MNEENKAAPCRTCKFKEFFNKIHTPTEKILLAASAVLVGAAAGYILSPVKGGINIEISVGSHNGCGNEIENRIQNPKK